ncbi:MAG: YidC/Oxa1 family membrane protein insertase [Candidatus Magasanikbacteria bacterium]
MISILIELWNQFLFEPTFNVLIWIYNNWAGSNLGWSVILLTFLLRLVLLPLTIINKRNKAKNEGLKQEIEQIKKDFKDDPVLQKQKIRETLKEKKVRPWAKVASLALQGLVLVLLYQVFLYGIKGNRITEFLYPPVAFPGAINTIFFGIDLAATGTLVLPGIVGLWLLYDVYTDTKGSNELQKKDLWYVVAFPAVTFAILWYLPAVKALFILASILFSVVASQIIEPFFVPNQEGN